MLEALRLVISLPLLVLEELADWLLFDTDAELEEIRQDFLDLHEGK